MSEKQRYYDGRLSFSFKGQPFYLTYGSVQQMAVIWIELEDEPDCYIEDCEYYPSDTASTLISRAVNKLQGDIAERRITEVIKRGGYNR